MDRRIRAAAPADYATIATLFRELGGDDPVPSLERYTEDLMPSTVVAEREAQVVGYAFFRLMREGVHLSHLVTAPERRREGIGRALLQAVARRASTEGAHFLQLNVRPENAPAICLYESLGLSRLHQNHGLKIDWALIEARPDADLASLARPIEPEDDAALETTFGLPSGLLAEQRARPKRIMRALTSAPGRTALAVFDLGFPGTYPFRAPDLRHAFSLLRALRPFSPDAPLVYVAIESQPELAAALLEAGAKLNMQTVFMRGPLPLPEAERPAS